MNYVKDMRNINKSKQKALIIKLYGTTTDLTSPNIRSSQTYLKECQK